MKKGEKVTRRADDTNRATAHRLQWACPGCGYEHPERNADIWETLYRGSVATENVECQACGAEFEIEMEGDHSWDAYSFTFTRTDKPEPLDPVINPDSPAYGDN